MGCALALCPWAAILPVDRVHCSLFFLRAPCADHAQQAVRGWNPAFVARHADYGMCKYVARGRPTLVVPPKDSEPLRHPLCF